jgi:hypothetical protein
MGSAVTIYLDLVDKTTRGQTPKTAGANASGKRKKTDDADDDDEGTVVPESPRDASIVGFDRTPNDDRAALRARIDTLREEARAASIRAREAEDALASAELAREAESAAINVTQEQVTALNAELERSRDALNCAKYVELQATTKLAKLTEEMQERRNECHRLRARVTAMETKEKLERELRAADEGGFGSRGGSTGTSELLRRFHPEHSGVDPALAIETLCRAVAEKNKQLHAQTEEYSKLTRNLRLAEKALRRAEARGTREASVVGTDAKDASGHRAQDADEDLDEDLDARASRAMSLPRAARGWGWDPETDGVSGRSFPENESSRRVLTKSNPKSPRVDVFPVARPFRETLSARPKPLTANHAGSGGPLSRVPATSGAGGSFRAGDGASDVSKSKSKSKSKSTSGEDLLDAILGGIDANLDVSVSRNEHSKRIELPPGSFLRRRGSDEENRQDADSPASGGAGGAFVIHGPDGRGGRMKIVRPGGVPRNTATAGSGSGALDRFLTRGS